MINENDFAQLGDSLATGFFIDDVVLCLARCERLGGRVEDQNDRSILNNAADMLDSVLLGEKWLASKQFNANSGESALAFDRAVRALSLTIRDANDFTQYIARIKKTLVLLSDGNDVNNSDIRSARGFFSKYGRGVLMEGQGIIDRSIEPQGVRLSAQLTQEHA